MKFTLLFLSLAVSLAGQVPCELTIKDSPVIRGLKLGMPQKEVERILPSNIGSKTWTNFHGVKEFEGIQLLAVEYYEGHLESLLVRYTPTIKWKDSAEFADALAVSLRLPRYSWLDAEGKSGLICKEFGLIVSADNEFFLSRGKVHRDKEAAEAAKKKAFKP